MVVDGVKQCPMIGKPCMEFECQFFFVSILGWCMCGIGKSIAIRRATKAEMEARD